MRAVLDRAVPEIPAFISMRDFRGCRTAMFGKTRLGKSNVVKLIAQGMLDATAYRQQRRAINLRHQRRVRERQSAGWQCVDSIGEPGAMSSLRTDGTSGNAVRSRSG